MGKFSAILDRYLSEYQLGHWSRLTHICVSKQTIICSDNGWSPSHYLNQWSKLIIGLLGTNFNEILIEIYTYSFKKMHLKMSSAAILTRSHYVKAVTCSLSRPGFSIRWVISWQRCRDTCDNPTRSVFQIRSVCHGGESHVIATLRLHMAW